MGTYIRRYRLSHAALACLLTLTGCVSTPPTGEIPAAEPVAPVETPINNASLGEEIAVRAIALVGKPYRYGGADLEGFDCSGLVYFIHQSLGYSVPRTAAEQQRAAVSVKKTDLLPGDLLFFKTTRSQRISHVGVYVGNNRFVHAPQSGKLIELRTLDDQYYAPRLASSGRLHPAS